jgi:DNA-binding FadR family transcriptional regulator
VKTAHRVRGETVRCETVIETGSRRIEGLILNSEQRVGRRLPSEPKLSAMSRVSRSFLGEALKAWCS